MTDDITTSLQTYYANWDALRAKFKDQALFDELKPVAVGWKVADYAEYERICQELHNQCDMITEKWMNGRWIAKLHLRDSSLERGVTIIKVMERRPGSTDAVGLDHLDFYSPSITDASLQNETDLQWTREENDVLDDYSWLSIWFNDTEAKIKAETVLNNIMKELKMLNDEITA